jgi:hypothetical protein
VPGVKLFDFRYQMPFHGIGPLSNRAIGSSDHRVIQEFALLPFVLLLSHQASGSFTDRLIDWLRFSSSNDPMIRWPNDPMSR